MVERIAYGGWDECYRLSNGIVEVIATAQVGPRLIRFGFVDGANEFAEFADQLGKRRRRRMAHLWRSSPLARP
jgi:hypothetical protein